MHALGGKTMSNTLLLISSGSTFMVDALTKSLKDVGIEVLRAAPQINELEKFKDDPPVFLFYLGNYLEDIKDVLNYIKDMCIEKNKILYTIGDMSEYSILTSIIPEYVILGHHERPINTKEVASKMLEILSVNESLSKRKTILLVDDDPTFLTLAKTWLETEYNVIIVGSGVQAITYLASRRPDLILLDYEMPITDGPTVLEMIKSEQTTEDIPVIFLTGKGDKESVMKVVSLKPNGYLLKTLNQYELLKAIREFFESID